MRTPRLNSFVLLTMPPDPQTWVEGRVHAIGVNDGIVHLTVITGPKMKKLCGLPPWALVHYHDQPAEADDSPAWRQTREAIAAACLSQNGGPRNVR